MKRSEKVELVEEMNTAFRQTPHVILASFRGLSVNQAAELRRKVRAAGGTYRVIKNRLVRLAAEGTPVGKLGDRLSGPCAIAAHESDPVSLAKALADFVKDNPQLTLLAGVVDDKDVLDAEGVTALSKLPGLLELRAQILSVLQAPASRLVRLLATPGTQLARAVDARREQQEGGGES